MKKKGIKNVPFRPNEATHTQIESIYYNQFDIIMMAKCVRVVVATHWSKNKNVQLVIRRWCFWNYYFQGDELLWPTAMAYTQREYERWLSREQTPIIILVIIWFEFNTYYRIRRISLFDSKIVLYHF